MTQDYRLNRDFLHQFSQPFCRKPQQCSAFDKGSVAPESRVPMDENVPVKAGFAIVIDLPGLADPIAGEAFSCQPT